MRMEDLLSKKLQVYMKVIESRTKKSKKKGCAKTTKAKGKKK
jgi:hypothetical protein